MDIAIRRDPRGRGRRRGNGGRRCAAAGRETAIGDAIGLAVVVTVETAARKYLQPAKLAKVRAGDLPPKKS